MSVDALLSPRSLDALFAVAVGSGLRALLVLLVALLATRFLRRGSAAERMAVWAAAMLALVALPVLMVVVPQWIAPSPQQLLLAVAPRAPAPAVSSGPSLSRAMDLGTQATATTIRRAPDHVAPPTGHPAVNARRSSAPWTLRHILTAVWAAGMGGVLLVLLGSIARLARLARRATPVQHPATLALVARLCRVLGVHRPPRVLALDEDSPPLAFGIVRPTVLLPSTFQQWPVQRLEVVLLHELTHVRHRDAFGQLVAALACALYWYNPIVWIGARRAEREREHACDDGVLRAGAPSSAYADELLLFARAATTGPSLLGGGSRFAMSALRLRVSRILDPARSRAPAGVRMRVATWATALALLLPLASLRVHAAAADAPVRPARRTALQEAPGTTPGRVTYTGRASRPMPRPAGTSTSSVDSMPQPSLETRSIDEDETSSPGADPPPADFRSILALPTAEMADRLEQDPDADYRRRMAWGLHTRGAAGASALELALRTDGSADVREMAAWALGQLRAGSASAALQAAVSADEHPSVRFSAFWALEEIGGDAALPALASASRDRSPELRRRALWYAGQRRAVHVMPDLVAALEGDDPASVRAAAWALGTIRAGDQTRAVRPLLRSPHRQVRQAAAWALHRFDTPSSQAALDEERASSPEAQHIQHRVALTGRPVEWDWSWTLPRPRTRP